MLGITYVATALSKKLQKKYNKHEHYLDRKKALQHKYDLLKDHKLDSEEAKCLKEIAQLMHLDRFNRSNRNCPEVSVALF